MTNRLEPTGRELELSGVANHDAPMLGVGYQRDGGLLAGTGGTSVA